MMRTNIKKGKYAALLSIIILFAAAFQGCDGKTQTTQADLISISVEPQNEWIYSTETVQFKAIGTFSDSSKREVTNDVAWSSSDTTVATIDAKGLAAGVWGSWYLQCYATTTITASSGTVSEQATLTVFVICDP